MCGIVGIISKEQIDRAPLERALDSIKHRGPDDQGSAFLNSGEWKVALGHRRLSIIDLSPRGHQPMCNEDGTVWIIYNGEVYNFQELRAELEGKGHHFRSDTDTETIVHLYEEEGIECLRRLNGMFAFAIWDGRLKRLLLARDRFGIKPLYYTQIEGMLLFGSEIKSLLCWPHVPRKINLPALDAYLSFLWVPAPETLFKDIYKLLPGHYAIWSQGQLKTTQYWDMNFSESSMDERSAVENFRSILEAAVRRQMVSDVPVGAFLSGGLDSSTVVALMSRTSNRAIDTYTIAYDEKDRVLEQTPDETRYAALLAETCGVNHHKIVVQPKVVDLLPLVVYHMDEPIADAAAISNYLVCQAAREKLTVVLSGQGSDELLAGYRLFPGSLFSGTIGAIPFNLGSRLTLPVIRKLPRWRPYVAPMMDEGVLLAITRFLDMILTNAHLPPGERFVANHEAYNFTQEWKAKVYSGDLKAALSASVAESTHLSYFYRGGDTRFLDRMQYTDLKTFLPELNLAYTDKLSMAISTEVRVPFLDNEVVDFAAKLAPSLRLRRFTGKYILRQAMDGIVPKVIIRRRKAAFGVPFRAWLRHDLGPMLADLLSPETIRRRGFFSPAAIQKMIEANKSGRVDSSYRIWALLTLELWLRTFLDQ
jgi:asparagine synthase (glutamine-hydrolysing)